MKLEVTKAQLEAIKNMADDMSAMIGCGGDPDATGKTVDDQWEHNIKLIDRMLAKNGHKRDFN